MKLKKEKGAQAIEFALLLPLLLAIVFLIVDLGFLVYNKAIITNASREAARRASVLSANPWSTTTVAGIACSYAKNFLISTNGSKSGNCKGTAGGTADPLVEVSNPNGNVPPQFGDPITVRVTYSYTGFLNPATTLLLDVGQWNLVASSTMNHE